jgi:hypothetical protein
LNLMDNIQCTRPVIGLGAEVYGSAFHRIAAMRARKGPEQATVATTHKIARIVYLRKYGKPMNKNVPMLTNRNVRSASCAN